MFDTVFALIVPVATAKSNTLPGKQVAHDPCHRRQRTIAFEEVRIRAHDVPFVPRVAACVGAVDRPTPFDSARFERLLARSESIVVFGTELASPAEHGTSAATVVWHTVLDSTLS